MNGTGVEFDEYSAEWLAASLLYERDLEPPDARQRVAAEGHEPWQPSGIEKPPRTVSSFDPDAVGSVTRDPWGDADPFTWVERAIEAGRRVPMGYSWHGYPSKSEARDKARQLRDSAERLNRVAGEIEVTSAAQGSYGRAYKRGRR
jgi:hypothetical protein